MKKTKERIIHEKKIEYSENLTNEIKEYFSENCNVRYCPSEEKITVWFYYSYWVMEQDALLKTIQKKYPKAYINSSFINIPIKFPEFKVTTKEIQDELLSRIKNLKQQKENIEKQIIELTNKIK